VLLKSQTPLPLYYQLEKDIESKILQGLYKPGDKLPSEQALMAQYGLSRITVREAMKELARRGIVEKRQGHGTYVLPPRIEEPLQRMLGFSDDMRQRGISPSSHVLSARVEPVEAAMAETLNVELGQEIIKLKRLRLGDGQPMAVETSHIPLYLCPTLLQHDLNARSLYELFEKEYGIALGWATQAIEPAAAGTARAEQLNITKGALLLLIRRTTYRVDGTPVEHVVSYYRSDRYKFIVTLPR